MPSAASAAPKPTVLPHSHILPPAPFPLLPPPLYRLPLSLRSLSSHPLVPPFSLLLSGLSGTGEADHSKPPFSQQPVEHHSAGAASFQGQKKCGCEQAGVCTCKGTCTCQSCTGKHTEAQLAGKPGQPEHPRPAVTGI